MSSSEHESIHDIYDTKTDPDYQPLQDPTSSEKGAVENPWVIAQRDHRRKSAFFIVVIVTLIITMVLLLYWEFMVSPPAETPQAVEEVAAKRGLPIRKETVGFDHAPDEIFLQEELQIATGDMTVGEGDKPLDPSWIKRATLHLLRAEKATNEGRFEAAIEEYSTVLKIFPDMTGIQKQVGLLSLTLKNYEKAIDALERAAREEVMSFEIVNNLGVAYFALKRFDNAEYYLLQALELKPGYSLARYNLGKLYLRSNNIQKAQQYLREYLELKPSDYDTLQLYALVLSKMGKWDDAIPKLEQLTEVSPDVASVYFRLAEALSHRDRSSEAMKALERGVDLIDPKTALAWMARSEFDLLRNENDFQKLIVDINRSD